MVPNPSGIGTDSTGMGTKRYPPGFGAIRLTPFGALGGTPEEIVVPGQV
jgi:hypothetical protein